MLALREKEKCAKANATSTGQHPQSGHTTTSPLITFDDFWDFQMLVAYHLEEVEHALTMFGLNATGSRASSRFGVLLSYLGAVVLARENTA